LSCRLKLEVESADLKDSEREFQTGTWTHNLWIASPMPYQ